MALLSPSSRFARLAQLAQRGFTLLELLVVLALIAAVAGLALPNFSRMMDSFSANTAWHGVEAELGDLPYRAFSQGRVVRLDSDNARLYVPALPSDWQMTTKQPIVYRENGWCDGGVIMITTQDSTTREYTLKAPKCEAVYP
jgi:general secretion pathway protein G